MIQLHIPVNKQGFTIIPIKEENPKLKQNNLEPSGVNTKFRLLTLISRHFLQPMRTRGLQAAGASKTREWRRCYLAVRLPRLRNHSLASLRWSLSFLAVQRNFSQESRVISAFPKASRTTLTPLSASKYGKKLNMNFCPSPTRLETTLTKSYNSRTPSSTHHWTCPTWKT